jgi:hypothetical protein
MAKSVPLSESSADATKLRSTLESVDCLAQGGFSEIAAIARLALQSLEHPAGYQRLDNIAHALNAIWGKAEHIQSCISSEAERAGCSYVDDAERRRFDALRIACEQGVSV